ncbi:DivIVA domain-containing protein [Modestobacter roseus]|uniref:Cell wall synthesis protein Wag31 n=1 Tax=Modestobacter roseus TaxID=1181884 RepID=A0A562IPX3_9ACTN|nr:DivIVA domain-containing protein [Modestobacter roseus]MQA34447.1 DivIVA domain-containing protein [Modestobacter roseus]TWH73067.1 DivIVA domain-containing protein [Modestobacter roseus]
MTTSEQAPGSGGPDHRLTPDDVRSARFSHGSLLHPGYTEAEVDGFVGLVAEEVARLSGENDQLRAQLDRLEGQLTEAADRPAPSDQAVGILATAQRTADAYVAEAEEFSRQMTAEARAQYEEHLGQARDKAGAIIQAAQEAATRVVGEAPRPAVGQPETEQLQEQIAYLRAFGQATRTQLRAYLEALLADVEKEWGHAHPAGLPPVPRPSGEDRAPGQPATFVANAAATAPGERDS